MIISASRRTDIPRFYSAWLMQRLRAGFCSVPNPFNPRQISHVDLRPQAVTAIVFWTRYPEPLVPHLQEIEERGYRFYFQITLNNYPKRYETNAEEVNRVVDSITKLAARIGPQRIIWRYDPIFFADEVEESFHLQNLEELCHRLQGCTHRLTISLIDEYRKTLAQFRKMNCHYHGDPLGRSQLRLFLSQLVDITQAHHLSVTTCAEPDNLADLNLVSGRCIDHLLINQLWDCHLTYKKDPCQRKRCGCMVSKDIGVNHTCLGGCVYCYATSSLTQAKKNYHLHDPSRESMAF